MLMNVTVIDSYFQNLLNISIMLGTDLLQKEKQKKKEVYITIFEKMWLLHMRVIITSIGSLWLKNKIKTTNHKDVKRDRQLGDFLNYFVSLIENYD